jgi:hypothetical protein
MIPHAPLHGFFVTGSGSCKEAMLALATGGKETGLQKESRHLPD